MNRRGLLAGILAAGFAPAAVGSGILMPVRRLRHALQHPWPIHGFGVDWTVESLQPFLIVVSAFPVSSFPAVGGAERIILRAR